MLASRGEMGDPNEQRQVMRSVGLSGLMGAALALEHCA